jgi:hypothetical protein
MHFSKSDIENFDKVKRLNLVNSLPGIKPVNLVGTISKSGVSNLGHY